MGLSILLLGPVEVRGSAGQPVAVGGPTARTLLARLAMDPGRLVSSEALTEALWDDDPPATARSALQMHVSRIRRACETVGEQPLATRSGGYVLDSATSVDVAEFRLACRRGRELSREGRWAPARACFDDALTHWRGEPLDGTAVTTYVDSARAGLTGERLDATVAGIEAALHLDRPGRIIRDLEQITADQPHHERLHELLMVALYRDGRAADALAVANRLRRALADDLGVDPTPAIGKLEQAVLRHEVDNVFWTDGHRGDTAPPGDQGDATGRGAHGRPPVAVARPPTPPTPLIGRTRELEDLLSLLASDHRLVTLTGPGGTGKTRLAVAAARQAGDLFPDGIHFVALAPVRDPDLVVATIARRLLPEAADEDLDLEVIAARLDGDRLVLLDNLEQVADAGGHVAELLARTEDLTILATSRRALRLRAERRVAVPPLEHETAASTVAEPTEAVRLFTERVQAVDGTFRLDVSTLPDVAEVCHRLQGLPLAIELAAARWPVLGLMGLRTGLTDTLALLVDGPADLPERHRTLRATIAWSTDMLTEGQRELLEAAATFTGLFDLDAWSAVVDRDDIAQDAAMLVECGLVQTATTRLDLRYWVFDVVGEFVRDVLVDDLPGLQRRHLAHHQHLGRTARAEMDDGSVDRWLTTLDGRADDILAAILNGLATDDPAPAVELVANLGVWWFASGRVQELDRLMARVEEDLVGPRIRSDLANMRGRLAYTSSDLPEAIAHMRTSLRHAREADDDDAEQRALSNLGGLLHEQGDYVASRKVLETALGLARLRENAWQEAYVLNNVGEVAWAQGDLVAAADCFRSCGDLLARLDHTERAVASRLNLASVQLERDDEPACVRLLDAAVTAILEHNVRSEVVLDCMVTACRLATHRDAHGLVAQVVAGIEVAERELAVTPSPHAAAAVDEAVTAARAAMGNDAWTDEIRRGRVTTLEDALAVVNRITAPLL